MPHHVHMMISIPPQLAVSQVIGYIKGKSAIHLAMGIWGEPAEFRRAKLFGHAGILCRRLAGMKR